MVPSVLFVTTNTGVSEWNAIPSSPDAAARLTTAPSRPTTTSPLEVARKRKLPKGSKKIPSVPPFDPAQSRDAVRSALTARIEKSDAT
jgi:hypothetical protein